MINDLKPYPAYKDSGVAWLGEVPEHWGIHRLKASVSQINDLTSEKKPEEVYLALENVESWTGRVRLPDNNITFESQVKKFHSNDVLFGKLRPYLAKVTSLPVDGVCVGEFLVLRPDTFTILSPFLEKILRSKPIIDVINSSTFGAKMPRADWFFIGNLLLCFPSTSEQSAIIRYLDYIDRRIRRYIQSRKKLIKLLEEQKQAIISQAVTRGLNPNVKLKPSGVEWLGDVPEHWEIRKLKYEVTFTGGGTPSKAKAEFWNGDIPWVSPKDMKFSVINDTEDHISALAVTESATKIIDPGTVLVVVLSGILRRKIPVAINNVSVALNQDMKALKPKGRLYTDYIFALIEGCQKALLTEWTKQGATVESIEHELMANSFIPIPPKKEQLEIVKYLKEANKSTYLVIFQARQEISLLREYRTRLISDVVTGKLDVREAANRIHETEEPGNFLETEDLAEAEGMAEENDLESRANGSEED